MDVNIKYVNIDLKKTREGDFIVHVLHGVGGYGGLKTRGTGGFQKEYINLGKFALEFISDISNTLKTKINPNPTSKPIRPGKINNIFLFSYEILKNL